MLIVEKIEGSIITVENDSSHININISEVIGNIKEGDILIKEGNFYSADKTATLIRRNKIADLQNYLFE